MSGRDRRGERLGAWLDGELGAAAARRMERRLAGSPEARAEVESLRRVGEVVRKVASEGASGPDLWDSIALRLPAADAERAEATREPDPASGLSAWSWLAGLGRPLAASAAAAAVVAALLFAVSGEEVAPPDVHWLEAPAPVLVFESGQDATIIWMLDAAPADVSGGSRDGLA